MIKKVTIDGVEYVPAEMQVEVKTCETCDPNSGYLFEAFDRELREAKKTRLAFSDVGGMALQMADAEGYIRGIHMAIEVIKDVFGIEA